MIRTLQLVLLSAVLVCSTLTSASDRAKEQRWAEQVADAIIDGDILWLHDGTHEFLTIYTQSLDAVQRAAIVIHGIGAHPDWQQVVQPLRVGLVEHGWQTLSLQMPILDNDADIADYAPLYDEASARINAAIDFLRAKGIKQVALVAHSLGANMGAYYYSQHAGKLAGFVAIGMGSLADNPDQDTLITLINITTPVLDVYGSDDLVSVLDSVTARGKTIKTVATRYSQRKVTGANHFFEGKDAELVSIVAGWLNQLQRK